jgi:predicted  nucleic acid-binding Zn-ribbon protein
MEYLKTFKIFENERLEYGEDDSQSKKLATDSLNKKIEQIKHYNNRKDSLEKLILDNRGKDAKDISKNIEDIIEDTDGVRNPFLSMYVSIVNKMKRIEEMKDKLDYFDKLKGERKSDLSAVKTLSDSNDRTEQTDKLNNQIKEIDENVSDMKDKIKELEKEIEEDRKDMEDHIKEVEQEFKDNVKEGGWSLDEK